MYVRDAAGGCLHFTDRQTLKHAKNMTHTYMLNPILLIHRPYCSRQLLFVPTSHQWATPVGYSNTVNKLTESGNQLLSIKTMGLCLGFTHTP
jgi:hypothetical protein